MPNPSRHTKTVLLGLAALLLGAIASAALLLTLSPRPARAQSAVIYVDAGATGAATGLDWTDAYTNVQDALSAAGSGDEIWVAEGVYYPDQGAGQTNDDRASTFDIVSGVALYGGFPTGGGDGTFDARDWETYVTVLSGDIDQNDTVGGDGIVAHTANISGSNAYHVVTTFEVTDTTTLDGFVVTAGYADLDDGDHFPNSRTGGGMINYSDLAQNNFHSMPQVSHVVFSGNYAGQSGGGMLNWALEGATLTDVTFVANRSDDEGGGLAFYYGGMGSYRDSLLEGLTFVRNVAAIKGGGMFLDGGSPVISNTTFVQNSANAGGGMFAWSFAGTMNPALTNTTFLSNTAWSFGGGLSSQPSSVGNITLTDVSFIGNRAQSSGIFNNGGGMYHRAGPATLTRVTFEDNVSDEYGGGFHLEDDGSTTMNEVSFIGNAAARGGGIHMGRFGEVQNNILILTHGVFAHNSAWFAGGGIRQFGGESTLVDVMFSQNESGMYGGGAYMSGGTMALSGATIANNTADLDGGGVHVENDGSVTLENSILWGNAAGQNGGGVYMKDDSRVTFGNSILWENTAGQVGGGVHVSGGTMALSGATIANNTADLDGGGLYIDINAGATLANSILWGNTADQFGDQVRNNGTLAISYSDVQGCGGSTSWVAACGTDGGNNIDADPRFVDAANDDLRLHRESPAIDAGNSLSVTTSVDLSGNPRRIDVPATPDTGNGGAPVVDMGAYEAAGPIPVLHKSVDPSGIVPYSSTVTYTLRLENIGVLSETAVLVTDTLPVSVTFAAWITQPTGAIHHDNAITWTTTVSVGERITLAFAAAQTNHHSQVITNTAFLSSADDTGRAAVAFSVNRPPVADAGFDQSVRAGATVTLDGAASGDPDGHDPLAYGWTQIGGPAVSFAPAVSVTTFTAPANTGVLTFTLAVTDSLGVADPTPDTVVLTITNQPPIADAGFDQSVRAGATVTLDGSASSDPDGHYPLAYGWTQTGGPAVSFAPAVSVTTFTAPANAGVLTFTLAVTDSLGLVDPTPDDIVIAISNYDIYLPLVKSQD